ncbi:hypothetical protein OAJ85_00840 [Pseudomonadota bacterium]|nr:hypothetical protein [Pseudomonadota bacterium]MDC0198685.1 hypothetical protein [Pseudomonadota bacterium]|tara:strand:- start:1512 stop:2291 length:780 start_codon:yes stop_codon:yes gene_type:complete
MKKVLIIGYGDIGSRIVARLPKQEFIGVSRSAPVDLPNVEFVERDWVKESKLSLPAVTISTVVLILKPTSQDMEGYQAGFLDSANKIIDCLNNNISYEQLIITSSTRVYGLSNGRNITEGIQPLPDDVQGKTILDYEELVSKEAKVDPLILRPSGLYDNQNHWMQKHVQAFEGKKYPLRFAEANMFSRANLALVIANYICNKESAHISGPLICSEQARKYSEIFSLVCPDYSFEDFFISSDKIGKSFDPQKLLDSGLMR